MAVEGVAPIFAEYWDKEGGLAEFGYPVSPLLTVSNGDKFQYFERVRLVNSATPGLPPVMRELIGAEIFKIVTAYRAMIIAWNFFINLGEVSGEVKTQAYEQYNRLWGLFIGEVKQIADKTGI